MSPSHAGTSASTCAARGSMSAVTKCLTENRHVGTFPWLFFSLHAHALSCAPGYATRCIHRRLTRTQLRAASATPSPYQATVETVTHTGQVRIACLVVDTIAHTTPSQTWAADDYRNNRFIGHSKEVNTRHAIKLIDEQPVNVVNGRVAVSESGERACRHNQLLIDAQTGPLATLAYSSISVSYTHLTLPTIYSV